MPHFDHDGLRLLFREQGTGPLLLILHGNTAASSSHEGELAHFGQHHRVVALDAPGCGQSERVADWPTDWWRVYACCAHALLDHLGQSKCAVVGTSGGAVAALWLAALYPDRVWAVIADSFVPRQDPDRLRREVCVNRAQRSPGQVAFWRHAHGDDWEQVIDADNRLLLELASAGGDILQGCRLEAIHCPVLLTASHKDDLLPADTSLQLLQAADRLVDGRVYLHSVGGHPLMWSQPHVFRQIAGAFLVETAE